MAYVEMGSSEIRKVYFEDGNIPLLCGFTLLKRGCGDWYIHSPCGYSLCYLDKKNPTLEELKLDQTNEIFFRYLRANGGCNIEGILPIVANFMATGKFPEDKDLKPIPENTLMAFNGVCKKSIIRLKDTPISVLDMLPPKPSSRIEIMLTRLNEVSNSPKKVIPYLEARYYKIAFTRHERNCNSIYESLIAEASSFPQYLMVLPELKVLCYQIAFMKNMTKRRAKNLLFKYYKAKCESIIFQYSSNEFTGNEFTGNEVLC